jgi:hypothetical protein
MIFKIIGSMSFTAVKHYASENQQTMPSKLTRNGGTLWKFLDLIPHAN